MMNLLGLDRTQLTQYFESIGEKPFRATQFLKWVHHFGVIDFAKMTNFSKAFRARLAENATLTLPEVLFEKTASDGTTKWLLKLSCGNSVETVFIPEKTRGTLCVSSQVGCGLNCSFCSTGKQGFNRDLTSAEIIAQVWTAVRALSKAAGQHDRQVTNVVMMGMGEPLLNFDKVVSAMSLMMDDFAYGLSKRRVTLSTSGLVPQMLKLKEQSDVALAVSLHAPNDELRNELVPVNKKYPLQKLMAVCKDYFPKHSRRRITFEYVMLQGVNDSIAHAKQLVSLLSDVPSKVNLIPFNPFPGAPYLCSKEEDIQRFQNFLLNKGFNATVRKTRGDDIDAACGQLVGRFNDKTSRKKRWQAMTFQPMKTSLDNQQASS